MRRVLVLGSTGSIGVQALDVLAESRGGDDPLRVVGLAAGSRWQDVLAQASSFDVGAIYLHDPDASARARDAILGAGSTIHACGSVVELVERTEPDLVLNAIVGFDGLEATVACLERGIDVALANKESLVAAGSLCMELAERTGASIIPVDSEHSALQQCIADSTPDEVASLVLTASGGPFRGRTRTQLADVTVDQALDHPTWSMGGKITIDSATLMNKGLELVEAMVLFDLPADRVEVVVNPTSIVHALVRHRDGSLLAHLGWPDMRVPIAWALHFPLRPHVDARPLDLVDMPPLAFERPDMETFRCLALARAAATEGRGAPCVLNAANEVAVAAFLDGRIGFLDIERIVADALDAVTDRHEPDDLAAARELDARARAAASATVA
jgi:1-deoxy-D-xylulose-5-phosphate reductoisomerase